jgi:hypothetical protein
MNFIRKIFLFIVLISGFDSPISAQNDTIFVKSNQLIICNHLKEKGDQYSFRYLNAENENSKGSIFRWLVDSVR